jgi:hypothetical protein
VSGRRRRKAAALVFGIRYALRKRYELIEVRTLPVVRDFDLDKLSSGATVVSRHWFRVGALQARRTCVENLMGRWWPHWYRQGIPVHHFPIVNYLIKIIS